ncbi:small secreted protein [Coprinellus micaceus]|uniref:NADH dehydrogenase [ubiquinone] 1 alpha subcomplex subunit 1 n=1 Tax=Coprinellus micaceus TaxID=71717 RepID=A0A4Y7TE11_COPMI|nr:small secreted protein [Coprinellus micaceus]
MPVPWEALIPFGTLLNISSRAQNQGKPPRYGLDKWEESMLERDRRLTGHRRGQTTDTVAPPQFATSSVIQAHRT